MFPRQHLFLNDQHMIFQFNNCMIFTCQFEKKKCLRTLKNDYLLFIAYKSWPCIYSFVSYFLVYFSVTCDIENTLLIIPLNLNTVYIYIARKNN